MIYLTQLIYIKEGQEETFHAFEEVAIPIIAKYKGELLLRIRPTPDSFIESTVEQPYEIHLVSFPDEKDFESFTKDEERRQFLHLKEQSVKEVWLMKGWKL